MIQHTGCALCGVHSVHRYCILIFTINEYCRLVWVQQTQQNAIPILNVYHIISYHITPFGSMFHVD